MNTVLMLIMFWSPLMAGPRLMQRETSTAACQVMRVSQEWYDPKTGAYIHIFCVQSQRENSNAE